MIIGVVSDTHNNHKNIDTAISIFNDMEISLVVHTGDITNFKSLEKFSKLDGQLIGVYGNNDRNEPGLEEIANLYQFKLHEPPYLVEVLGRSIAIFHEPDKIDDFLVDNLAIDVVLHGHTHRYRNEIKEDILFFNPGESAGIQKGRNALGIVDLKNLEAKRIFF
jgi:putative phosphoesterase